MIIKMLVAISGNAFSLSPGDETDRFSADEIARMIEAGIAVPVSDNAVEHAVRKTVREKRG